MKQLTFVIVLILFSFTAFSADTVEQRLVKLENKISKSNDKLISLERINRTQSVVIANYKAKVDEIELQRSFLSDIYNGNSAWLIGLVSLVVVLLVGVTTFFNWNSLDVYKKSITDKVNKNTEDVNSLLKNTVSIEDNNSKMHDIQRILFGTTALFLTSQVDDLTSRKMYYDALDKQLTSIKYLIELYNIKTYKLSHVEIVLNDFFRNYTKYKTDLSLNEVCQIKLSYNQNLMSSIIDDDMRDIAINTFAKM